MTLWLATCLSGDLRKLRGHVVLWCLPSILLSRLSYGSMSCLCCCHNAEGIVGASGPLVAVQIEAGGSLEQDGHDMVRF